MIQIEIFQRTEYTVAAKMNQETFHSTHYQHWKALQSKCGFNCTAMLSDLNGIVYVVFIR